MNFKQIIYSAVAYVILAQIVNTITATFTLGYYTNPAYFSLWSSFMMSTNGPPQIGFYVVSVAFNLLIGLIFAGAYSMFKESIPGKGTRKGLNYGVILFLISGVPFSLTIYLLLAVPSMLILAWTISSLVAYLLIGVSFSKLIK